MLGICIIAAKASAKYFVIHRESIMYYVECGLEEAEQNKNKAD